MCFYVTNVGQESHKNVFKNCLAGGMDALKIQNILKLPSLSDPTKNVLSEFYCFPKPEIERKSPSCSSLTLHA